MKEMRELREEIGEIVKKLKRYEEIMARNRGPFELFGLFLKDEDIGKWDLLVAADWIEADKKKSLEYIIGMLQKALSKEELMKMSRVVLIKEGDPAYEALSRTIGGARDTEIYNSTFYGWRIKYAYIITWRGRRMGKKVSDMDTGKDKERLNEIDRELKNIHDLFAEYHSWYDKKTRKIWFPPGRYFDYDKMVDREHELLTEREAINERLKSA